jgi:hypothetical protein
MKSQQERENLSKVAEALKADLKAGWMTQPERFEAANRIDEIKEKLDTRKST